MFRLLLFEKEEFEIMKGVNLATRNNNGKIGVTRWIDSKGILQDQRLTMVSQGLNFFFFGL